MVTTFSSFRSSDLSQFICGLAPKSAEAKESSRRELKEVAVRDRIHATAPGVVDLALQAMAEPLHRGQLKTVVVAVRTGG